jgi:hypothetical protein
VVSVGLLKKWHLRRMGIAVRGPKGLPMRLRAIPVRGRKGLALIRAVLHGRDGRATHGPDAHATFSTAPAPLYFFSFFLAPLVSARYSKSGRT